MNLPIINTCTSRTEHTGCRNALIQSRTDAQDVVEDIERVRRHAQEIDGLIAPVANQGAATAVVGQRNRRADVQELQLIATRARFESLHGKDAGVRIQKNRVLRDAIDDGFNTAGGEEYVAVARKIRRCPGLTNESLCIITGLGDCGQRPIQAVLQFGKALLASDESREGIGSKLSVACRKIAVSVGQITAHRVAHGHECVELAANVRQFLG